MKILNKEGTLEFEKDGRYYNLTMTNQHPLWNSELANKKRGGTVEDPESISWDSWIGLDVTVNKGSRIEGGSCLMSYWDGSILIDGSFLSGVYMEFRKPLIEDYDRSNTIKNSELRGPIRLTEIIQLNIENSKLDGMFVSNSKARRSITVLDSRLEGQFLLDSSSIRVIDSKFKGEYVIHGSHNTIRFNNSNLINSAIIGANDYEIFNNKLRTENHVTGYSETQD